jgi:hypothetical protein
VVAEIRRGEGHPGGGEGAEGTRCGGGSGSCGRGVGSQVGEELLGGCKPLAAV